MSKIGRKPIPLSSAKVEIINDDNGLCKIKISGPKAKFEHELPEEIGIEIKDKELVIIRKVDSKSVNALWGLHRALLANKVKGVEVGFELLLKIVGLGYKGQLSGKKLVFALGYSHKIDYVLPEGVTIDIDKTGQNLTFKSHDKGLLGNVCDELKRLRPVEPYKGTGVMRSDDIVIRKAGKTGA